MAGLNEPHPAVRLLHGSKMTELRNACDDFEQRYFKTRGYEPTLIWCIKEYDQLLSDQISVRTNAVCTAAEQRENLDNISDSLLRYTQLVDALETMQNRRVPGGVDHRKDITYHGQLRHVRCRHDNETNDRFFDLFSNYIGVPKTAFLARTSEAVFGKFTNVLGRVIIGTTAGASLLIPMIIMSFESSRTARLIIVSLFTIGFGFTVGVASPSTDTVIAATAAYAAVMVVYIGSGGRA